MSDRWLDLMGDPERWTSPVPPPLPIHTSRLVVRCYQRGDGPGLFEAISAERPSLLPHMAWALTDHQDVGDSIHFVESARRAMSKPGCRDFPMGIFDRRTGQQLGGTGFHALDDRLRKAEVGYWIRGSRRGEGLCTEAIGALLTQGFLPRESDGWAFRRLLISNNADNVASRRVCEKLGLRLECRERAARHMGGELGPGYVDCLTFAVLETEWDFEQDRAKPHIGWD